MNAWHDQRDGQWLEAAPPANMRFVERWLMRQKQLVEDYRPDLMYFDDAGIPFGGAGLEAVAHFYRHSPEGVLTAKRLGAVERQAIVEDVERGFAGGIRPEPWQTDTCIGNWHYDRRLYENGGYKSAKQVIQRLADVVSKNGNLLLNIPVRGDGTIDDKEERIVDGITAWMSRNGEAIHDTRPWRTFGEGPTKPPTGLMAEDQAKPFTSKDVRFTRKGDTLYAILLDWPESESAIASLGTNALPDAAIERVELLDGPPLEFRREAGALRLKIPPTSGALMPALRIRGRGLV
jgi:alpha-L-fucosidase